MSIFRFLVSGILFGLFLAAPVGPIGVLCIRRTLAHGRRYGFVSGLGVATADGIYALLAVLGFTAFTTLITSISDWLGILGGAFLLYLGVTIFRARPADDAAKASDARTLWGAYLSILLLTLTNPMTILTFGGFLASFAADPAAGAHLGWIGVGIPLGSLLWWAVLAGGVGLLRGRLTPTWMLWVNRVSGTVVFLYGAWALGSALV